MALKTLSDQIKQNMNQDNLREIFVVLSSSLPEKIDRQIVKLQSDLGNDINKILQMRYRWEKMIETDIHFVWEFLNRKYFGQMLERAKRIWKLKGEKAKWLYPKYYRRLVKYWMSDAQQMIAARHATNRESDPTYFGGSVRMMQYQSMLDKEDSGDEANKYPEVVSPSVFKATKSKNCKTLLKSLFRGKKKHNVYPVEESVTETKQSLKTSRSRSQDKPFSATNIY